MKVLNLLTETAGVNGTTASFTGSCTANSFIGSGSGLTSIPNAALVTTPLTNIIATGNLSSSGGTTPTISLTASPTFSGNVTCPNLITTAQIVAGGNLVAGIGGGTASSGTTLLFSDGTNSLFRSIGGYFFENADGSGQGNISAGYGSFTGVISAVTGTFSGVLTATQGLVVAQGAISAAAGQIVIQTDGSNALFRNAGGYYFQSANGSSQAPIFAAGGNFSGIVSTSGINFNNTYTAQVQGNGGAVSGVGSDLFGIAWAGNAWNLALDHWGNLGIRGNVYTPSVYLGSGRISDDAASGLNIYTSSASPTYGFRFFVGGTATQVLSIDKSGNMSTPGSISVKGGYAGPGDIGASRAGGNTGVIFLNTAGNRYLFFDGGNYILLGATLYVNGVAYASSRDYKHEIAPIGFDSVEKIKALNAVSFKYLPDIDLGGATKEIIKSDGDKARSCNNAQDLHHGFIAEDSPKEFISEDGRGFLAHTGLAIALDAIKQLALRIEILEKEK